jgi:6-phosphogluconolactonase (cycloisomerase 2 family)
MTLSSPYYDQNLRSQKSLIAGGQKSNNTVLFERDLINRSLTRVAEYTGPDSPVSYIWL